MYIVERCGIETWDVLQLLQPWGHPGTPTNKVAASVSLSLSLCLERQKKKCRECITEPSLETRRSAAG